MAVGAFRSDTGLAPLPDVGELSYNGVTFSSLYRTKQSGGFMADEAGRTTMYVEWSLEAEGYVTLDQGLGTTDPTMDTLRELLSVPGGTLTYRGRGFGRFTINPPGGGGLRDVAWGPVPKILRFQPLGAGRGAFITWQVTSRIPEFPTGPSLRTTRSRTLATAQAPAQPVLQWNYECGLTYGEDGYSGLNIRGTLEVPITRISVNDRTVQTTVDTFRQAWLDLSIDLTKFRVVRRSFNYSRDKRKCDWEFVAEELPPMGLPPYCTDARGTMSIRPATKGYLLRAVQWVISLKATYTVRGDQPRRIASEAFYALWDFRMRQSELGEFIELTKTTPPGPPGPLQNPGNLGRIVIPIAGPAMILWDLLTKGDRGPPPAEGLGRKRKGIALPLHFAVDEGLYLDSKTSTFEASWILMTDMTSLLLAGGIWRWRAGTAGGDQWALSMRSVSGWRSWLANSLDPAQDVIVDLGGGTPPTGSFGR